MCRACATSSTWTAAASRYDCVDNITDKSYWASAGGSQGSGYLVLGAPRTVALTASTEF